MSDEKKTYSYDEVPYPNNPFPQSHPDRLATIAALFGVNPQQIGNCRVLELGCGRGGNLVPMAEQLPASQFVGVELSEVQANEAKQLALRAGLDNVKICKMNIMDVDTSLGQFDYIIAHGVFSWVPRPVQDKIIDICSRNLSPRGVAYVSYNVYPGWNMRGMIRDMMCFHASRFPDPKTRISQARGLLDFMAHHSSEKSAYGMFLKSEVDVLRSHADEYLYHEHLEDVNEPVYFFQFMERCHERGLKYLGEADMSVMYNGHFPAEIISTLEKISSDYVEMEQYLDFVRNRMFRQTLLCHQQIEIDRELKPSDLNGLHISTTLCSAEKDANLQTSKPFKFSVPGTDRAVTITHPLAKAAIISLTQVAPESLPYEKLLAQSRQLVDQRTVVSKRQFDEENQEFGKTILKFYVNGFVDLHMCVPSFSTSRVNKPVASRIARAQLLTSEIVTTLRHGRILLNPIERHILKCLDGNQDRGQICDYLASLIAQGELVVPSATPDVDSVQVHNQLMKAVEETLGKFAKVGLLVNERRLEDADDVQPIAKTDTVGAEPSQSNWMGLWNV
jgi:methyltransferase-like protein/SAM-dependent methyltransferase